MLRHRCKTSSDLLVHLQSCLNKDDAAHKNNAAAASTDEELNSDNQRSDDKSDDEISGLQCAGCRQPFDDLEELKAHVENCKARLMDLTPEVSITEVKGAEMHHPMENKVFVWNQMPADSKRPQEIKPALTIER